MADKYIFVNGVMKINPDYKEDKPIPGQQHTVPDSALTVVSTMDDIQQATTAQEHATQQPMQLPDSTSSSIEIMQQSDFVDKFESPTKLDGSKILEDLSKIFAKYEVPIGLLNKLLPLLQYQLNFIVDDSGSMQNESDALLGEATRFIKQRHQPGSISSYDTMTRWEEAEDRIHIMIDMLAYIPTGPITISFLNRPEKLTIDHRGQTPEQFAQMAHQQISTTFNKMPYGYTPIFQKLSQSFNQSHAKTMHYLFTDGVPTDNYGNTSALIMNQVKQLIASRNTQMNPLTFMSCTNIDAEAEWMKEIEGKVAYTAELDDFIAEGKEVAAVQGPAFPFSKGFWLICQLAAAINPIDLDAMDECVFTKGTLDNILGRKTTMQEYDYYFMNSPNAKQYMQYKNEFAREDLIASTIIENIKNGVYNRHVASGFAPSNGGIQRAPNPGGQSPRFYQNNNANPTFYSNGTAPQTNPSQEIDHSQSFVPNRR